MKFHLEAYDLSKVVMEDRPLQRLSKKIPLCKFKLIQKSLQTKLSYSDNYIEEKNPTIDDVIYQWREVGNEKKILYLLTDIKQ